MWDGRMAPEGMDVVTSRRERAALDGTWAGARLRPEDGVKEVAAALAPFGVWSIVVIAAAVGAYVAVKYCERRATLERETSARAGCGDQGAFRDPEPEPAWRPCGP